MDRRGLRDALSTIVQGRKTIEEMIRTKGKSEFLDQLESQFEIQHDLIRQFNESNLRIEEIVSTFEADEAHGKENETIVSSIFPHKFFNESGQEINEMQSAVNIPAEVLERILQNSGRKNFLSLRPVCNSWNEEVCRLLTMNLGRIHKNGGFPCFSLKICQELYDLLKESLHPGVLIKEVRVSSDMNKPVELPTDKNPFEEFGAYVKRLKIEKDADLGILHTFLVQEGHFCPNVEILDYFASESTRPFCPPVFQSHLKLKKLRLHTSNEVGIPDQAALLIDSFLNNSPELTSLTLESYNSEAMSDLCNVLLTKPFVTSNLNKICIKTKLISHLEQLTNCHFSNKLKTVKYQSVFGLGSVQDVYVEPRPDRIMEFLTTVAQSLERFEFEIRDLRPYSAFRRWNTQYFHDLPEMPNLKVLSMKNFSLESLDLLEKVPSLKVLNIYGLLGPIIGIGIIGNVRQECFVADWQVKRLCESQFVHNNLEQVTFHSQETFFPFSKLPVLPLVNKVFPKLSEMTFDMEFFPYEAELDRQREYIEQSFQAISQMKNLKVLEINLYRVGWSRVYKALDLTKAFAYFKENPKLEKLIFFHEKIPHLRRPMLTFPKAEWLVELLEVPKLRDVEFYGFTMGNEKENFQEMMRCEKMRFQQKNDSRKKGFKKDIWSREFVKIFAAKKINLEVRTVIVRRA